MDKSKIILQYEDVVWWSNTHIRLIILFNNETDRFSLWFNLEQLIDAQTMNSA